MPYKFTSDPAEFIQPLNINRLDGRVLRLPEPSARRNREMLVLYGHHSSLERMYTLAAEFNRYGPVTMPDWPGLGGMDSMFSIGKKPTIEAMADYLAAFVKLRYRRRRFTIVGISYGFAVATNMVQRYPELAAKVDFMVSIAGFVRYDDFRFKPKQFKLMRSTSRVLKSRLPSALARGVINGYTVQKAYTLLADKNAKMKDATPEQLKERIKFEKQLWRINDMRTHFFTANSMFKIDLCDKQVALPAYHVAVQDDQYLNNALVEQHLAVIYKSVSVIDIRLDAHMPTIVATPKEVAPFIPNKLRRLLAAA